MRLAFVLFLLMSMNQTVHAEKTLIVSYFQSVKHLDPHQGNYDAILQLASHVFSHLVHRNADFEIENELAESVTQISDLEWRIVLNSKAKFSDGSPVSSKDIKCTFDRMNLFTQGIPIHSGMVEKVKIESSKVAVLVTKEPYPLLLKSLVYLQILSCRQPGIDSTAVLPNDSLVGSGPFEVESLTTYGLVLTRNTKYWGRPPEWDKVIYRFGLSNPVQALKDGRVDFVAYGGGNVPSAAQMEEARGGDKDLKLVTADSYFTRFIAFDHFRTGERDSENKLDFLTKKSGAPILANPLKEVRFRKALSLAIDRRRYQTELTTPIGFVATAKTEGVLAKDLVPPTQNIDQANALLDELASENPEMSFLKKRDLKIRMTIFDEDIAEDWRALGFGVEDAGPQTDFYGFQIKQQGWGLDTGDLSSTIKTLFATQGARPGWGNSNGGRYSSRILDKKLGVALENKEVETRNRQFKDIAKMAIDDYAILPLYALKVVWLARKGLCYPQRYDGHTYASQITSCAASFQ